MSSLMKEQDKILDKDSIKRCLMRIAHEILEKNQGTKDLALIGIRNRGAYLAQRLRDCIEIIDKQNITGLSFIRSSLIDFETASSGGTEDTFTWKESLYFTMD